MKGKIDLRFSSPNVSKIRNRLSTTPVDFTKNLRSVFAEAVESTLEKHAYTFKSECIRLLNEKYSFDSLIKSSHIDAVCNPFNDFFSTSFAIGPEAAKQKFSNESEDSEDSSDQEVNDVEF